MADKIRITEEQGIHKEWYKETKEMTLGNLPEFLRHLTEDYAHDYGTVCHAVAASAIAAAEAVNNSGLGGITGFQAGAVMWEFITHWIYPEDARLQLRDMNDLLYPQMREKFTSISKETWDWLQKEAQRNLSEKGMAVPDVVQHWENIVEGIVPFGLSVGE